MTNLIKQLKSHRHDASLGGVSTAARQASWAKIASAIGAEVEEPQAAVGLAPAYRSWLSSEYLSRPVMVSAFSVFVIASGWLTTAKASDSLPGDRLYSIKRATEQAQLNLASLDRKAVLHTEFAERRLREATDLQETLVDSPEREPLVKQTLEDYKQEVASAGQNLRQLKDEKNESALAVATSLQQNLQTFDTVIDDVGADSNNADSTNDVMTAKEATKEARDVATTVAVEVHEEENTVASEQELKAMFKAKLGEIEARQRFDVTRVQVIRAALLATPETFTQVSVPSPDELAGYEYTITTVDSELSEIMNNFAAGGYRTAFERLQQIDATLLNLEATLAQFEITIMNARLAVPSTVPEVPASELPVLQGELQN